MMTYLMCNSYWPTSVYNAVDSLCMFHMDHAQFFGDAGFGKMKHKFRITKVGCLNDFAPVMQTSTMEKYSHPVDDQQDNSY